MILVGTAPRGGDDIMHLEKPSLARHLGNPEFKGYAVLQKIFFAPTDTSQAAGAAFIARLEQRKEDREPRSGQAVAQAQIAAFREWEQYSGERFADLRRIDQPTLVVNGVYDEMIPVANSGTGGRCAMTNIWSRGSLFSPAEWWCHRGAASGSAGPTPLAGSLLSFVRCSRRRSRVPC
jgi:pimeloyl-ACP methyl ester carboxylesterase